MIDAALYGSVLRILEWTIAGYDRAGIVREREGNRLTTSAPLDNYPTADGKYVCLVAGGDVNYARLCAAMGRPELVDDPRFVRLADRAQHSDEINGIVAEWTATLPASEVEARAIEHDVPVATAYTAADICADPHMAARADLVAIDDPVLGPVRQQAPFPRFVGEDPPRADRRAPPRRAHPRGAVRARSASPTPSSTSSPPTASSEPILRRTSARPNKPEPTQNRSVSLNQRARQRSSMVSPSRKPKLR